MISFPGVSSLENSEERSEPGWGSRRAGAAAAAPRARGCPRGSPPLGALPCPPSSRGPCWKSRHGGSRPRGGSEFPWPPSGSINFFSSSSALFTPRGHICARSVGQPWARVRAGRSRAYLPRGVWKPTGANTPRGTQGQVESGVCVAARVGRGLFAAPPCVLCFLLCLRRPRWMRCDPGVQAWAVQIKSS